VSTLWSGRFESEPSQELMAISVSRHFDRTLVDEDIAASRAHVRGLGRAGILTDDEVEAVLTALDQVEAEFATGSFTFVESDEDVHTAVERRVTELAGDAGAKLHTGRSRNDQIATDVRLWVRGQIEGLVTVVLQLQQTLLARAEAAGDAYLPGYTHLQQAQPVLLAHHLLAHGWALARDVDRLLDTHRRTNVSPLGAGALAGSSLPLDPGAVAADLGFDGVFENSLDAVSDRDFGAELLFDLALLGVHLSRLAEEVIIWSSQEFGFVHLADSHATGSSMLPQKKNPDIAELTRGKSGRLIGNLTGLLATLKGLPLAYNRDLQEDKEPIFDSVSQTYLTIAAMNGLMASVGFDTERMRSAADTPYAAATDLAEWLVERGVPFRSAHEIVGGLVRRSLDESIPLAELVRADERLGPNAASLLEPGAAVMRRTTRGGAGPAAVADQLDRFRAHLATTHSVLGKLNHA
jgi:argininosuccinate lyase